MKTKLILTGLTLMASITFISAQGNGNGCRNGAGNGQCVNAEKKSSFVDANKDGVCDNKATKIVGKNGLQKSKATAGKKGNGQGKFVDTNKNGVCDNSETAVK